MEKYLNYNLKNIFKETSNLDVSSLVLNRKNNTSIENKLLIDWMDKYCLVYHQLVREFNPKNIKLVLGKYHTHNKKKHNLTNSLEDLLKKLYTKYPDFNNNLEFDIFVLIKLKNAVLKPKPLSTNLLSDWFNDYNQLIYDSDVSILECFKKYLLKPNIKDSLRKIISEIINHLSGCNKFMSFNIHEELKKGMRYNYVYSDDMLDFKVHSFIKIDLENDYWRFLYARMKSVYTLYKKNINVDHQNKISFEIYLSNEIKELPNKNGFFGPREINSGCTDYNTIVIWRKEEHMKLILHESIHYYNLDGSFDLSHQNDKINLECHYQIGDNNETRIYEAYTETLATFLNSFANSYQIYYFENKEKGIKNQQSLTDLDLNKINNIRKELWNLERKFSLIQISKIFLHFNPSSNDFNDFLINSKNDNNVCKLKRSRMLNKLEQRTSVLSYHILKGANIFFDLEFIKWLPDIFKPHPKSLFTFFDYIVTRTHDNNFIKSVNQVIKYLKSLKTYNKNLRMTFYESELNI
jgi:hypothetical protein